jgi:hypothetical protein
MAVVCRFVTHPAPPGVENGSDATRDRHQGPCSQVIAVYPAEFYTGGFQCNGVHTFGGVADDLTST